MPIAVMAASSGLPNGNNPFSELSALLSNSAHEFLRPTPQLQQAAVQAAKIILDPLAVSVANAQTLRRNENRRKRKRGEDEDEAPVLQLRQVYTKGFGVKQIWEQAKRVLDAACQEVAQEVENYEIRQLELNGDLGSDGADADVMLVDDDDDDDQQGNLQEELDSEVDDLRDEDLEGVDFEDEDLIGEEDEEDIEDGENIEDDSDIADSFVDESEDGQEEFMPDKHGLNDGFFSIDDFNKQSQFLEQMDARGDDDNPSDEDEVDWDADPLTMPLTKSKSGKDEDNAEEDDEDEDEEDGPTFGNANLDASDDDEVDEDGEGLDDAMGLTNANDVRYADFFEPPPKKPSKNKRMRALPKTQPPPEAKSKQVDGEVDNDIERAIADVRRDLLDSDEGEEMSDDEDLSEDELGPRKTKTSEKNMSTHEKQRAAIAAEIRQLEAANVAKRDWQLSGEARAADRPLNSLIEEDLEFERAGKPVPVVTAETSEEIEQLVKRRILARDFDEVIRRQPGAINAGSETRRGRIEVDDSKPQTSLGEIYEQEHLKTTDPLSYIDKRSATTKKQHEQIDILWREVRDQLDSLSNLHFKPKRIDVSLKTVEDKPRIAMEDARPTGDLEAGEGGMLAPQEVYKPNLDTKSSASEVLLSQTGASLSREEMTREEKLRRRRREKERSKKAKGNVGSAEAVVVDKAGNVKRKKVGGKIRDQEKADIISDLKRGNVKVIGKGGVVQGLDGKKGKNKGGKGEVGENIGSNLKL